MRKAERLEKTSRERAWLFPVALAAIVVAAAAVVSPTVQLASAPAAAVPARLTWAVAAMLFSILFAFSVVTLNTLMFRCGERADAFNAFTSTTLLGVLAVALCYFYKDAYLGPSAVGAALNSSALCLPGVRGLSAVFDGFAIWAAVLVVATSCVIVRREAPNAEELSRQLRGSRILMHTGAALLIAGVAQTSALHKWPASEPVIATCGAAQAPSPTPTEVQAVASSVSATVGTIFSMVLAAAYLPLGILLRQRAYRTIKPWERTEAWLAIHGFALLPTQQLANVLLILSPLIAGGPVSHLLTLLSRRS